MSATDPIAPEPCRFSIRLPRPLWIGVAAAFLVVVALGLQFGLPIYRQHVAIREIERLGGQVRTRPRGPEWFRDLVGEKRLMTFDDVEGVLFRPDEATFNKRWVGGGFSGGPAYTSGRTIDDAALACIAGLPNLKRLVLTWTNVSDAGMEHVCRLRHLEELDLDGTDVSEVSVDRLVRMRNLKELTVDGRRISKSALARLAAELPECDVVRVDYDWLEDLPE